MFPDISSAARLQPNLKRLFIGAYGFEERSLGWVNCQREQGAILNAALVFRYRPPKGKNRISDLRKALVELGTSHPNDISINSRFPHNIEDIIDKKNMRSLVEEVEEIIVDISAMTKLLILVCLSKLKNFIGTVRIVYSEAENYAPTQTDYQKSKKGLIIAKFPSRGFESIVRTKCLSSIRMQGQPVSMIVFTSFNEQLVRHMLGTINPHRLLFINGRPPRTINAWREHATQEIHSKIIEEYEIDNPSDETGLITRVASTLDYKDTINRIHEIYKQYGTHERIICAATGSKMQTVGLFFAKAAYPDIHIEYPTPDSYFVKGMSEGIRKVHEVVIPSFSEFLKK